ncbi:hypothetical protein DAPPUDRAFT_259992 [Daphnia pulex]|uniref:Uncharacterized protein n=1 Tax=Daphnia pulex TaxID=6669 RepID=E9HI93_DAPPU|nr:hypothetical protein DAPPUDRAFT_259992 [Daphnia pulex]|eukprot:EFX68548.1 hypothetical protein DAPPUDRAFT_259992 [Daphnia pulex]
MSSFTEETSQMIQMSIGIKPIPNNVNQQKERTVCISFMLEGHGDHYEKLLILWCRDPSPAHVNVQKERLVCMAFKIEGHGDHNLKRVTNGVEGG